MDNRSAYDKRRETPFSPTPIPRRPRPDPINLILPDNASIRAWPIYMFLMLFIVTLFYGFALSNGTLIKTAEKIIYKSRNYPAALPFVLFFICMLFAGTGAGAPAAFAFLSPLVMVDATTKKSVILTRQFIHTFIEMANP